MLWELDMTLEALDMLYCESYLEFLSLLLNFLRSLSFWRPSFLARNLFLSFLTLFSLDSLLLLLMTRWCFFVALWPSFAFSPILLLLRLRVVLNRLVEFLLLFLLADVLRFLIDDDIFELLFEFTDCLFFPEK